VSIALLLVAWGCSLLEPPADSINTRPDLTSLGGPAFTAALVSR
jgi:hypothetical protein